MTEVRLAGSDLFVRPGTEDFKPRHESQLAYWGFQHTGEAWRLDAQNPDVCSAAQKLVSYFERVGIDFTVNTELQVLLAHQRESRALLESAIARCRELKDGNISAAREDGFIAFLKCGIRRQLKDHQVKAALHLLTAGNGANFSVPGSGKTAVVLSVFEKLRQDDALDSLFVVGPPACFAPWRHEYSEVLGKQPVVEVLAGGDIDARRSRYLVDNTSAPDLFLTTFQTLQRDWSYVGELFLQRGIRFFLVIDEAHYIKQIGGTWATAVLNIARYATRRCVLTGTPFPRSFVDAFNLFDVLWPPPGPIGVPDRHRISLHVQRSENSQAAAILDTTIGPLFYRVRKEDLNLAEQVFHEPVLVTMNDRERLIYDSIINRIVVEAESDFFRDFELLMRLRRGRIIRLRQCLSYAGLLRAALPDYEENLLVDEKSLATMLAHYDDVEAPAKIEALIPLVHNLRRQGSKVVVWSNFVGTLHLIVRRLSDAGHCVDLIYGGTPFEQTTIEHEHTREQIIRDFADADGRLDVLVANPAACAESVSLHKCCSHAIYYDLSYNCAQYLQSLDRIHRVGGSETKPSHYHFLQYRDSIENDILINVRDKARNMAAVIDREYALYNLDMFEDDGDLEAYQRLFSNH